MGSSTFLKLTAVCFISSMVPSAMALRSAVEAAQVVGLLPRADQCGGLSSYSQCGASFPSNFCCPGTSNCLGFSNNASVICCPKGNPNCNTINPLSCDIQFYNATAHPESPMHTTNLGSSPQTCGTNTCCPPGYTCITNSACVLDSVLNTPLSSSVTAAAATAKATLTTASAAKSTASPSSTPAAVTGASASASCNPFPIIAILVGLFPGMIAGALITFFLVMCIGRRHRAKDHDTSSITPMVAKVSDPIYHDTGATRTDFLRHASKTGKKSPNSLGSSISALSSPSARVRSLFSRTPTLKGKMWDGSQDQEVISTPPGQIRREPSMESIKIYSPPEARQTTFGDMLRAAGGNGQTPPRMPFMGSPGLVDPRSRAVDNGKLK